MLSNIFCCNAARPIEAKFYVELLSIVRITFVQTVLAAMPIYGKNPSKIFSETSRPITSEQVQGIGAQQILFNYDPGLTLVYFTAMSTLLPIAFVRENA